MGLIIGQLVCHSIFLGHIIWKQLPIIWAEVTSEILAISSDHLTFLLEDVAEECDVLIIQPLNSIL